VVAVAAAAATALLIRGRRDAELPAEVALESA
jgi:hypothetical protein